MHASTLPTALMHLVDEHGATYAPLYPPDNNADHGPMACLALHGLGFDVSRIEQFAAHYQSRLVAQNAPAELVNVGTWRRYIGGRAAYPELRQFFASQIELLGWQAALAQYLPVLVSGWVKDAFHPMIRLAYGIEFSVASEIASGLAYLTTAGNDPELAAIADRPAHGDATTYLESLQPFRNPSFLEGRFNARYRAATHTAALHPVGGRAEEALRDLSRSGLEVFHSTHEFFALHLVTASHAFRVCSPWAGPNWSALFSAGIGAAYLSIGAPPFAMLSAPSADLPLELLAADNDEHDIKIAYSSLMQSRAFNDPAYQWVAACYLSGRQPGPT